MKEGDTFFVSSLRSAAVVVSVDWRQGRARMRSGSMEVDVALADLRSVEERVVHVTRERTARDAGITEMDSSIKLVGRRVDEAISLLEPFLNHASLAGLSVVIVIHGIGKGLLMRAVREHLTGHPLVKAFRRGEKEEGGAGVTVVTLDEHRKLFELKG